MQRISRSPRAKRFTLSLTEAGQAAFSQLSRTSEAEVASLIAPLSPPEQRQLIGAMTRIRSLLGDIPRTTTFVLRDPEPGDLGWVIHKQSAL